MGNENEILDGKNKLRVEVERILEEALKTARRNVEDEIQKWFDKQNLLIQDKLNEGTLTTYADADAALSNFEKEFMERFSDLSLKERKAKLFEYQYRKIRDIYSYIIFLNFIFIRLIKNSQLIPSINIRKERLIVHNHLFSDKIKAIGFGLHRVIYHIFF